MFPQCSPSYLFFINDMQKQLPYSICPFDDDNSILFGCDTVAKKMMLLSIKALNICLNA